MQDWADKWGMKFHPQKCKVMRIGTGHADFTYTMRDDDGNVTNLEEVEEEKDLGIVTDKNLKFRSHINQITKKANQKVGLIKRSFTYLSATMFKTLFKSLVRPTLEYAHSVWHSPWKQDIREVEKVQRRATKLVKSLSGLEYGERLRKLDLPSMMYRQNRGDMIEVWKILHGKYDQDFKWLKLDENSKVRRNSFKLYWERKTSPYKRRALSQRVVMKWNALPDDVVTAKTLNVFKNKLDHTWRDVKFDYL